VAQVLVDGLPADSVITGKDGFGNTAAGALDQLDRGPKGGDADCRQGSQISLRPYCTPVQ
jgi:hypothetical protein